MKDELQDDVRQLQEEIALLEAMEEQCPNSESLAENSTIHSTSVMEKSAVEEAELIHDKVESNTSTLSADNGETVEELNRVDHANMDTLQIKDVGEENHAEITDVRDTLGQENIETVDEGNIANQASIETVDLGNTVSDVQLESMDSDVQTVSKSKGLSPAKLNADQDTLNDVFGSQTVVEESDNDMFDTPTKEEYEKQPQMSASKRNPHSQSANTSSRRLSRGGKKSPPKDLDSPKKSPKTMVLSSNLSAKQSLSQPKCSTPLKNLERQASKSSQKSLDSASKVIEDSVLDCGAEHDQKYSSLSPPKTEEVLEIPVTEKEFSPVRSPTPPNSPTNLQPTETTQERTCMYTYVLCYCVIFLFPVGRHKIT